MSSSTNNQTVALPLTSLLPSLPSSASPTSTSTSTSSSTPSLSHSLPFTKVIHSFFPTPALDHAFAGTAAGAVATICMNPLDLIKTKFQVDTKPMSWKGKQKLVQGQVGTNVAAIRSWRYYALGGKVGNDIAQALQDIVRSDGWKGLYRGLSPNVAGNSASWGLYFLFYTMIKEHMSASSDDGTTSDTGPRKLSAGEHLLAASESGAITALITNPIWVVKTRMFTTPASASSTSLAAAATARPSPEVYRGLWHGLSTIARKEGLPGLYKGAGLALFGVSNGAIQFMSYEELKKWRTNVALRNAKTSTNVTDPSLLTSQNIQLSNTEYTIMSGASKVLAILMTYPYQVIRSRIQNHATSHIYTNVSSCIRLTYTQEGLAAFYKGLVPNLVRILPGTCVTFVVYENVSWTLKRLAQR